MNALVFMESFAAVVEQGSFTAAAVALNVSKPAVSKQVSQLERQLGVQLLNRTTRRLRLTEAGERFYAHCRRALDEAREAELAVAPMQNEPQGILRVAAPQCLALSLFKEALPVFQMRFPKIRLELSIGGRMVDLIQEGFDAALRIGELEDSTLIARRLAPTQFIACASPEYWHTHGRPAHPRELGQHNCLIYSESTQRSQWKFREKDGTDCIVTVGGNLSSDDASLLLNAAIAHRGVVMGPSFMFAEALDKGLLEPVLEEFPRPTKGLYAIYPNTSHLSRKVQVFVDFLQQQAAAYFNRPSPPRDMPPRSK